MSTLKVDAIVDKDSGNTTTINGTTIGPNLSISSHNTRGKNIVINGGMEVSQRNGGTAVTPTSDQTYTLDRFSARLSVASKYSVQQVADGPSGFYNSLKVTSAAATTPGTNDYYQINTPIEGYFTNKLAQGSSAAKQFTLSFYVKSSLTGTFGGAYSNNAGNKFYAWTYTINSANTWERKSITITGSTDGSWESTTSAGLWVYWTLGAGSGQQASPGSWSTTFKRGPTGATNVVATSGATWQITGVQLELGDAATEFEHESIDVTLYKCQRYYQVIVHGSGDRVGTGGYYGSSGVQFPIRFNPVMRASPTIVTATGSNYWTVNGNGNDFLNSVTLDNATTRSMSVYNSSEASGTAGYHGILVTGNANSYLHAKAEL